jgi:hypothetical protein
MVLTVLAVWICLAVPAAAFVAALGRSALLEDRALGHLPAPGGTRGPRARSGAGRQAERARLELVTCDDGAPCRSRQRGGRSRHDG